MDPGSFIEALLTLETDDNIPYDVIIAISGSLDRPDFEAVYSEVSSFEKNKIYRTLKSSGPVSVFILNKLLKMEKGKTNRQRIQEALDFLNLQYIEQLQVLKDQIAGDLTIDPGPQLRELREEVLKLQAEKSQRAEILRQIDEETRNKQDIQGEIEALERKTLELEKLKEDQSITPDRLEELGQKYQELENTTLSLQKEIQDMQKKLNEVETSHQKAGEERKNLFDRISQLEKEVLNHNQVTENMRQSLEKLENDKVSLRNCYEELVGKQKQTEQEIADIKCKIAPIKELLDQAKRYQDLDMVNRLNEIYNKLPKDFLDQEMRVF